MWRIAILITVAVAGLVETCEYKKTECPDYLLIEQHPDFEDRFYVPLTWVTTSVSSRNRRDAQYTAFKRLFNYFSGENSGWQRLKMTVPVRMSAIKSDNGTIFEVSLMIPFVFAVYPPLPKDDDVKIKRENATMYAVRSFQGYVREESQWLEEAKKLAKSIGQEDDDTAIPSNFYQITFVTLGLVETCTYKKAECPDYAIIEQHPGYEVRLYGPITWATASISSPYKWVERNTAFRRLKKYMNGQNDREQKMAKTAPMRTSSSKPGNETILEMNFMVPSRFAVEPPVPTDDDVKIVMQDAAMYVVRTFKGYLWNEKQWLKQAGKLAESVKDDDTVIRDSFFEVEYDGPNVHDVPKRRNEIWMAKKVEHQIK